MEPPVEAASFSYTGFFRSQRREMAQRVLQSAEGNGAAGSAVSGGKWHNGFRRVCLWTCSQDGGRYRCVYPTGGMAEFANSTGVMV